MRILWSIHLYPPAHNCGAEYVAHHVNKYLISQGHEVRVMLLQGGLAPYVFEGVEVVPYPRHQVLDAYTWADVVFTHLDYTRHTMNICRLVKRPVFHFMHNDEVDYYRFIDECAAPQYMVYNSEWIANRYNFRHQSTVLYPPCPADYYEIEGHPHNNEYVTLINTNENKGGYVFARLAEAMPDIKFLAVKGSYDDGGLMPAINDRLSRLPNVTVMQHCSNPRQIYQRTRILLVLSRYESWGRVATEAMSNGIPVLYCPTQGLCENVQNAGIALQKRGERITDKRTGETTKHDGNSYDIYALSKVIESLNDPAKYKRYYRAGKKRYAELQSQENTQLDALQQLIYKAQQDYKDIRAAGRNGSRAVNFS